MTIAVRLWVLESRPRYKDITRNDKRETRFSFVVLRYVGLSSPPLDRDSLRLEDFVLQREHRRRGLIDPADERDRSLQDRLESLAILDARLRVLVFDDERRAG